jgi:hypothetical protein
VANRYSVLLPFIADQSYRRALGGLISKAQDAAVLLSKLHDKPPPLPPTYGSHSSARRTRTSSIK